MATVSTFRDDTLPQHETDVAAIRKSFSVANGDADAADVIQVFQVPVGASWRLHDVTLRTSASLGASATLQARVNRSGTTTNVTAATTAAAASKVNSSAQAGVPFDLQGGDILELVVAGAGITASAGVTVDALISNQ